MLVTSSEHRHRRYRITCIDVIAMNKMNVAGSVTRDRSSCRIYEDSFAPDVQTTNFFDDSSLLPTPSTQEPQNLLPTPEL